MNEDFDFLDDKEDVCFDKLRVGIHKRLLKKNVLIINSDINEKMVELFTLNFIELSRNKKPIYVVINSTGGNMYESINIFDVMESVNNKVITICLGCAMSGGFIAFMGGDERLVYPQSTLMMHQIKLWITGENRTSVVKEGEHTTKASIVLAENFAKKTKKSKQWWIKEVFSAPHDYYFTPEEAVKYGIATRIIKKGEKVW